jgi:branched-chain amino acid transport system permease protein
MFLSGKTWFSANANLVKFQFRYASKHSVAVLTERFSLNQLAMLRVKRIGLFFATLIVFLTAFAGSTPASAQSLNSGVSIHTEDKNESQLIVGGTVKNDGKGVADIKLRVTGPNFDEVATTDENGKWELVVPTRAKYEVAIDLKSLPEGVGLRDPENAVRVADVTVTDKAAVLFPLGKGNRVIQSFSDQLVIRLFAGLNLGLLLAVSAIGISLIFGTTGLNNFAHGEMVTFGALTGWLLAVVFQFPLVLAGLLTVLASAAFGYAQDAAVWKPLRKRRVGLNQMMIVSIGFAILLRYVLLMFFGGDTKVLSGEYEAVKFGPVNTTVTSIWSMALAVITLAAVALFLTRTRIGKATRAVSDNSSLAAASGIDVEQIIRIVWVVAGALTGLSGLFYGLQFQATFQTGSQILLLLFAAVTLGGLGTALGATVGALIIGFVVELSSLVLPVDLKYAAALVILILVLLVRPQGVLGKKQRIG